MKSKYLLFCICLSTAMGFASCSDDEEAVKPVEEEITGQITGGNSQSVAPSIITTEKGWKVLLTGVKGVMVDGTEKMWTFDYDKKGRLTSAVMDGEEGAEVFKLSHEPFKLEYGGNGTEIGGTLNDLGYLATLKVTDEGGYMSTAALEYDQRGQLIKVTNRFDDGLGKSESSGTADWTFTWEDGKITDLDCKESGATYEETYHLDFINHPQENKYRQYTVGLADIMGTGFFGVAGLTGKAPVNSAYRVDGYMKKMVDGEIGKEFIRLENGANSYSNGTFYVEKLHDLLNSENIYRDIDKYTYSYTVVSSTQQKAPATRNATTRKQKPFRPFRITR